MFAVNPAKRSRLFTHGTLTKVRINVYGKEFKLFVKCRVE
jgi:hypothetical protein